MNYCFSSLLLFCGSLNFIQFMGSNQIKGDSKCISSKKILSMEGDNCIGEESESDDEESLVNSTYTEGEVGEYGDEDSRSISQDPQIQAAVTSVLTKDEELEISEEYELMNQVPGLQYKFFEKINNSINTQNSFKDKNFK